MSVKAEYEKVLFYQEDPEPSIGVMCTLPSVTYNPSAKDTVTFKVHMVEGSTLSCPSSTQINFLPKDGAPTSLVVWTNNSTRGGIKLTQTKQSDGLSVTLTISKGATLEGMIKFILTYKSKQYWFDLPLIKVEDGENAVGLICSTNSVTYNPSASFAQTITFQVRDGEEFTAPTLSSAFLKRSALSTYDLLNWERVLGMALTGAVNGDKYEITLDFNENATAQGIIDLDFTYNGQTYGAQISVTRVEDGQPGEDVTTIISSTNTIVYNPVRSSSETVEIQILKGRQHIIPLFYSAQLVDGPIGYDLENGGEAVNGLSFSGQADEDNENTYQATLSFARNATAKGYVEMVFTGNGESYHVRIALTRVEDGQPGNPGENAVSVLSSLASVTYNPSDTHTVSFQIQMADGNTITAPSGLTTLFFPKGGGPTNFWAWGNNSTKSGIKFSYSLGTDALNGTFTINKNAELEGVLRLTLSYRGKSYEFNLPFARVTNGVQGPRGAVPRGPRNWDDVVANGATTGADAYFYSGAEGESLIDIALCDGNLWDCKVTHSVVGAQRPSDSNPNWAKFTSIDYVATKLLLAELSYIQNLVVDNVQLVDLSDSNNPKVLFAVYKDNQGQAHIYSGKGTFENVVVKGDIQVDTMTYTNHLKDEHYPLTSANNPSQSIQVKPEGGCIIVPQGKSDLNVILPAVAPGTVRQVTIINQKLPANGSPQDRSIYLLCETDDVWIFPKLNNTAALHSAYNYNQALELEYGAYNLYGYSIDIYLSVTRPSKTITAWSLWKIDNTDFNISNQGIIPPNNPEEILINGTASNDLTTP